jgi:hypothetical protein
LTSLKGKIALGVAGLVSHENMSSMLILGKHLWIEVVCQAKLFIQRIFEI